MPVTRDREREFVLWAMGGFVAVLIVNMLTLSGRVPSPLLPMPIIVVVLAG